MKKLGSALCALLLTSSVLATTEAAHADDTIKHPGDHPNNRFEFEPHVLFGWADIYGGSGIGLGGRVGVTLVDNGFVPSINNSVAISFGVDYLHYGACYFNQIGCGADFLFFPVVMQWNFYVAQSWSVFGEPGLYIWHGFFDTGFCNDPALRGTVACPSTTGLGPALYLGGRYHFNEHLALTMRVGYPTLSVGVSFM